MHPGIIAGIVLVILIVVLAAAYLNADKEDKGKKRNNEEGDNKKLSPDNQSAANIPNPMSKKEKEAYKKEKKEREWADVNEKQKFVCHGGKVQCPFANPPMADIIVTSSTIMLQDKPWASVKDKDGKVNFNFTGVCTHPSQQKPSAPPPPCKAVISLGEWKDYSDTMIGDNNALLVKSTIPCTISGQDLKIVDSGQKAELSEVKPKTKREPQIIESYWINEDGERIKKIAPNKKASLVIKTKDYRPNDKLTITLSKENKEEFDSGETEIVMTTHVDAEGIAILENIYMNEKKHLKKKPRIVDAYWQDKKGNKLTEVCDKEKA
ncbi:MAG: DUF4280 domain-containing protein, partial [Dysgonamonadaceae bacterium]|nr:DUF4280 domain-containing protein [Dysgonamonadaceae bacterium]